MAGGTSINEQQNDISDAFKGTKSNALMFHSQFSLANEICPGLHSITCMPTSITVTKCPFAFLVNFNITAHEKCNLGLHRIVINYYFAGTYQRSGEGVSEL